MTGRTRIWPAGGKPGIEAVDPPELRHDHPQLMAMAEIMLTSRRTRFPEMIAAGEMDQASAEAELRTFEHIAADWRFIVTGEGEPAPLWSLIDRREALDASLATIADIAARQRGFSPSLEHQAQCVIALRWHLEPERQTIALARFTHQLRAEAAAKRSEQSRCH